MKKTVEWFIITFVLWLLAGIAIGCAQLERAGQKVFRPVVTTNTFRTNLVVNLPDGTIRTEPRTVEVVSTNNWEIRPGVAETIRLAGDVAPVPWAGLAADGMLAALGVGALLMGRKYKKATVSAIDAASQFREELRKANPTAAGEVKDRIVGQQRANGTKDTIESILRKAK